MDTIDGLVITYSMLHHEPRVPPPLGQPINEVVEPKPIPEPVNCHKRVNICEFILHNWTTNRRKWPTAIQNLFMLGHCYPNLIFLDVETQHGDSKEGVVKLYYLRKLLMGQFSGNAYFRDFNMAAWERGLKRTGFSVFVCNSGNRPERAHSAKIWVFKRAILK